jgi:hypothetical protein
MPFSLSANSDRFPIKPVSKLVESWDEFAMDQRAREICDQALVALHTQRQGGQQVT